MKCLNFKNCPSNFHFLINIKMIKLQIHLEYLELETVFTKTIKNRRNYNFIVISTVILNFEDAGVDTIMKKIVSVFC